MNGRVLILLLGGATAVAAAAAQLWWCFAPTDLPVPLVAGPVLAGVAWGGKPSGNEGLRRIWGFAESPKGGP